MPAMQTAMGPLNERFNARNVGNEEINPPDAFAEGIRLADLVDTVDKRDAEYVPIEAAKAFIESMPEGLHEAIRAVIRANLLRDDPLPITFAWQPGYDWELTINDVSDTEETRGGITMIVKSRYPSDRHPMDRRPVGD
jgi:hypothetical protein